MDEVKRSAGRPRGTKGNPLKEAYKSIFSLLKNAEQDRNIAIETYESTKARLVELEKSNGVDSKDSVMERGSLRSLMIEAMKLAQSSKQMNLKLIDAYLKNQNAELERSVNESKKAIEEGFMGDG